jgi:hypothetical protein
MLLEGMVHYCVPEAWTRAWQMKGFSLSLALLLHSSENIGLIRFHSC